MRWPARAQVPLFLEGKTKKSGGVSEEGGVVERACRVCKSLRLSHTWAVLSLSKKPGAQRGSSTRLGPDQTTSLT